MPKAKALVGAGRGADIFGGYPSVERAVDRTDDDLPPIPLPAEAMYAALLETQAPVPFERRDAAPDAPSPASEPARPAEPPPPANAVLLKGPAAALARNMDASLAIPTATTFREIPVRVLELRRADLNGKLKAAGRPTKLSFTHLIAWALVRGCREFPGMGTAVLSRSDGTYRLDPEHVNLGLAVDVERKDGSRGLVVPVLKAAEAMDFGGFLATYEGLVEKARTNKLMPDDFAGATMTLTNPGGLGTVASVPRLMPGQGTIIATGAIAYPPEFREMEPAAAKGLGISKVMMLTSTYDHRVIQGAESGSYLRLVDEMLQGGHEFYHEVYTALGLQMGELPSPATPAAVPAAAPSAPTSPTALHQVAAAMALIKAIRTHGHLAATLDPLGTPPAGDPAMDPATLGLTPEVMATIPSDVLRIAVPGATLAEALPHLLQTYCGNIAYEIEHIASHERRVWLRQQVETGAHTTPLDRDEQVALLTRLTQVEGMERFLGKAYLGAKRFGIEGLDMMVPMLDLTLELAAEQGVRDAVLGMAHRGRLNVLAHTVGRPYEAIFAEFEGGKHVEGSMTPDGGTGDVKYHHGAEGAFRTRAGKTINVSLASNPSHLEFIGAVVDGRARAKQTSRRGAAAHFDPSAALPVIIHGDAAFPGQGVVPETLNLGALRGYGTGGTLHLIANNQVGFTTDPNDARSTRYASDLAKGFDIPIIHVNADDPEACLAAVRLAMAYRTRFRQDVVIDLVGYRRNGHNESDEPSFTQPVMYAAIKEHPSVRELYAGALASAGTIAADRADQLWNTTYDRFVEIQSAFKSGASRKAASPEPGQLPAPVTSEVETAVAAETLNALNEQLVTWPGDFHPLPKLAKSLEKRRTALIEPGAIEWAHAEALAFASLLVEGTPIRLTGQDCERGTFSQRHLVLHDINTGGTYAPIQALPGALAPMELFNSPLSELAAIGFEYGYATAAPEALVLWEAQFGDFVNGAQVMIDQFVSSSLSKWGVTSRLTFLLPHGYEGQGPEHSSARLERFLQLAAEGNIRVANPTTPAQYFHLLRRQAMWDVQRPLVVMTPKSLLRKPEAGSSLADLAGGRFETVLDDASYADGAAARSLVLCSGKIFYDLMAEAAERSERPPVARVEQLYPLPADRLRELLARYPSLAEVVWTQEEPRNMGAWSYMEPRLRALLPEGVTLRYAGRPERASPAEGYPAAHAAEQARIVGEALGGGGVKERAKV
ncbi:MAG TPA: multifunctional oxoglutarate decarboxylase/oxoglutarate dehydrogenase thiamine pyrophosphate-binding subunit/dihydrolipoyllysine-residue succinyltransferase subunit [Gemmatimonadales bacterium]|nr:multifunctional oxoglutarate decarboxylase/oxoglutarate dehydrogenase thiamine pyrophosphate-binding subunit/dihydrolipoyllysine-residue succinyltransferase subunit [Gemmatimonadales bacterium]